MKTKNMERFTIARVVLATGAMLIFSVSFQFYRILRTERIISFSDDTSRQTPYHTDLLHSKSYD